MKSSRVTQSELDVLTCGLVSSSKVTLVPLAWNEQSHKTLILIA